MHETVLENSLRYNTRPIGHGHQHHYLGLQVRGKTRVRKRCNIDALDFTVTLDSETIFTADEINSSLLQLDREGI